MYFLAFAHQQLGNRDQARQWYDQAITSTDQITPDDPEIARIRAELADLLNK